MMMTVELAVAPLQESTRLAENESWTLVSYHHRATPSYLMHSLEEPRSAATLVESEYLWGTAEVGPGPPTRGTRALTAGGDERRPRDACPAAS